MAILSAILKNKSDIYEFPGHGIDFLAQTPLKNLKCRHWSAIFKKPNPFLATRGNSLTPRGLTFA